MTWLITGGCGFIGTNLANALLKNGEKIVIIDNLSRVGSNNNLNWLRSKHGTYFRFIKGDTRNANLISDTVKKVKPATLAHLAGQVAVTKSLNNPRYDFEVNVRGTINVLEAVRLYSPETVILYSSTNKVYGNLSQLRYIEKKTRYELPEYPNGLDESLPLSGHSPYGCSKLSADQYMQDYFRMYKIRTVVFRHSSMYGERQFATHDQGWIGWFCKTALKIKSSNASTFTISGDGKQVRDVLHADDLIRVYMESCKHIDRTSGQVYNIGGGISNSLSLLELFKILEEFIGFTIYFQKIDWRPSDQKYFVADYRKATNDFGWVPRVNKIIGIKRMVEWTKKIMEIEGQRSEKKS